MLSKRGAIFPVHNKQSTIFPSFGKPKIIGYWSLDQDRKVHWDSSQLRYYVPFKQPNVEYDLKEGSSIFEMKADFLDSEKSECILRWIERNYEKILDYSNSEKWLQADFILYRSALAKIIRAPYMLYIGWIICAAKFKGTIYLCQYDNDHVQYWKANEAEKSREKWSWGLKFQQYMLTDAPGKLPDTSKAVKESEEFCSVYQNYLNDHRLVYAAKVVGLCSDKKLEDPLPLNELELVELKIRTPLQGDQIKKWKKNTSLCWWAQNYLIGVEDIIYGERDWEDGIVRRLEKLRVSDLQRDSEGYWNAAICMNFGDEFLKFIKNIVKNDYNKTIYKFERKSFGDIVVTEEEPTSKYAFLPDWYINLSKK